MGTLQIIKLLAALASETLFGLGQRKPADELPDGHSLCWRRGKQVVCEYRDDTVGVGVACALDGAKASCVGAVRYRGSVRSQSQYPVKCEINNGEVVCGS